MAYRRPYGDGGGGRYPSQHQSKRGGGQPFNSTSNPTEIRVRTNQNKLLLLSEGDSSDFIQCEVSLKNGWYKKITDEATGEESKEWGTRDPTPENAKRFLKTPLPWRIMKKWAREHHPIEVAYDGAAKAYFPSEASGPEFGREYRVQVKRDCEEDDPDAERVRSGWFAVTFQKTISIPFQNVMAAINGENFTSEEISMMLNVILRSVAVLTDGMISLAPNAPAIFFPLHKQRELLRGVPQETRDKTKILLSGSKMLVVMQRGGAFVQTESIVQYANKDYFDMVSREQRQFDGPKVPLLDTSGRNVTIAGVSIGDAGRPITDAGKRAMIEEAIGKKDISIEYENKIPGRERRTVYKGKSLWKDREETSRGNGKKIIWSACDATEFTFKHKDKETDEESDRTVADFFNSQYANRLKFPHMPIIYINNICKRGGGWFPIEFGFQAFGKSKENNEDMVNNILKYHDVNAGKDYIEEVGRKQQLLSVTGGEGARFEDRLRKWRIKIENRAMEETAKVLKPPRIKFKNDQLASARNGSFNLNRVSFSMPAKLTSFVVANFTRDKTSCNRYVQNTMRVARSHGVDIPSTIMDISQDEQDLDLVTQHYIGRDDVGDALDTVSQAIQKGKNFHLYDSQQFYRRNNSFFKTFCYREQRDEYECIVLPPTNEEEPLGLLLDYNKNSRGTQFYSHRIETRDGKHDARLMVRIKETKTLIDPLDFRFHERRHQACRHDGTWQNATFVGTCYYCPQENELVLNEADIVSKQFVHLSKDWEIDFPSIVFSYKPDDGKALYNRIKVMSNHFGGIQSQCAVQTKYTSQRNKDQYCSNIATKINAKLSTIYDKAVSWTSESGGPGDKGGLPWIGESPTLVVGVGMVHGMGYSSKSVVAASLCLDSGCMRLSHSCFIQKKSDTISDGVMKDIIKVSIKHYVIENNCNPERILFYRDGMSDGNFPKANVEIESIKAAAEEQLECPIPITFVICQSQQLGFRMVPSQTDDRGGRGSRKPNTNAPSGTVLECGPSSFYMIAQGGMKGTSKPVKYIVHLNENVNPSKGHGGLTIQNLIECTNQMCWKYPTATKAVREIPMIKYAKKLGNQVLASLMCLEAGCHWFGKNIRLVCPADDALTEEEMRPYMEMRNDKGDIIHPEHRQHNIVEMPFRNHLAA